MTTLRSRIPLCAIGIFRITNKNWTALHKWSSMQPYRQWTKLFPLLSFPVSSFNTHDYIYFSALVSLCLVICPVGLADFGKAWPTAPNLPWRHMKRYSRRQPEQPAKSRQATGLTLGEETTVPLHNVHFSINRIQNLLKNILTIEKSKGLALEAPSSYLLLSITVHNASPTSAPRAEAK